MTEPTRPALDVSSLPTFAFGARDPLWWALIMLMAIEGTMFVLLVVTYTYLRGNFEQWPPTALTWSTLGPAALGALVLVGSGLLINRVNHHAQKSSVRGMRRWLIPAALACWVFVAIRAFEIWSYPFTWNSHAYGSVVWTLIGLHSFHAIAGSIEDLVLIALLYKGPVEQKHLVDVHVNGLYWYFVVVSGLLIDALLYLDPAVLRSVP
jgi:cytochrome c oxidase subunit III